MTLVELCAGSAAVSLRYLSARGRPPLAYQGGKRGYADAILQAMGLAPGGGRGAEIVLCEPGPWGEAWDRWRTAAGRADTIERLRAWQEEDPRALWERLRAAPVPTDPADRAATWATLQWWGYRAKPVLVRGEKWRVHGVNPQTIDGWPGYKHPTRGDTYSVSASLLPELVAGLQALPDLSSVHVLRCSALEVPPISGAIVYLDPPYRGTTCAYGHSLPRAEVLALAARWRAAGAALVCVSEAEPLSLHGWHAHELGSGATGRNWSGQKREFLTMSRPAGGQLALIA